MDRCAVEFTDVGRSPRQSVCGACAPSPTPWRRTKAPGRDVGATLKSEYSVAPKPQAHPRLGPSRTHTRSAHMSKEHSTSKHADSDGVFRRQTSTFRSTIAKDGEFPPEKGRYSERARGQPGRGQATDHAAVLYIALICPWACRAAFVRSLKALEDIIDVSVAGGRSIWRALTTAADCHSRLRAHAQGLVLFQANEGGDGGPRVRQGVHLGDLVSGLLPSQPATSPADAAPRPTLHQPHTRPRLCAALHRPRPV